MFFTFFHIHFGVCLTNCIGPHCQTEGNKGGVGKVFEFKGAGVALFSVFERATICNMGAGAGATSSLFSSDTCPPFS
ncbi:aconitase family protein [Bilophila wadsworthia]|uniref:aconitase family protein n=1 Tax=Bilophila wadsworthia TaxID=35833 RepID=UPI0038B36AE9